MLNITSVFHLHFANLVQITWSGVADVPLVLCFLSCPRILLYIRECEWCFECTYHIVSLPNITPCNCLTFTVEQPTDFWPQPDINPAPVLLCDLNSYNSLLFPYMLASLIVLSVLSICRRHHCLTPLLQLFSPPVLLLLQTIAWLVSSHSSFSTEKPFWPLHLRWHPSLYKLSILLSYTKSVFITFITVWIDCIYFHVFNMYFPFLEYELQ